MSAKSSRAEFVSYLQRRTGRSGDRRLAVTGDHPATPRSYAQLLTAIWRIFSGSRLGIACTLGLLVVATILAVAPAALTKLIIDYLLHDRPLLGLAAWFPADRLHQVYCIGALVAAAAVLELVMRLAARWYIMRAALRAQLRLKRQLFGRVMEMPLHFAQQLKAGGAASILRDDVPNMPELAINLFYETWRSALRVVGSLAILLVVDWRLLLGMLCLAPLVYVNHRSWTRRIRPLYCDLADYRQRLDAQITELFSGLRIVRAFGRMRAEQRRYVRSQNLLARMLLHLSFARTTESIWEATAMLASIGALVYGASRVIKGELTLGDMVMFLSYLALLLGPLEQLANSAGALQRGLAGLSRMLDWLESLAPNTSAQGRDRIIRSAVLGRISLHGVGFTYPGTATPALQHIHLDVRPGEVVALVGSSGAGKTTLCNLIARFYEPTEGMLELDGRDIRDLDITSYRSLLGIVEQDVFLFDGTIAENISYGIPTASRSQIVAAAQAAHLHEFIESTELGYETRVGERGHWLSGGQRQRLAIARALIVQPKILILDEATSSLDYTHEQAVQRSLEQLMAGRTCFVIAHRLSTILRADRIVLLHQGRILELGSHGELLERRGAYWQTFGQQFNALPRDLGRQAA